MSTASIAGDFLALHNTRVVADRPDAQVLAIGPCPACGALAGLNRDSSIRCNGEGDRPPCDREVVEHAVVDAAMARDSFEGSPAQAGTWPDAVHEEEESK